MYFLQITQAPITVKLGEETLTIPKYPMSEIITWGAEIQSDMEEKVTSGLSDIRRREYMTLYPILPPSLEEMKRMVRTPEGIRRVLTYCIPQAEVRTADGKVGDKKPVEFVENLLMINGAGRLGQLAWLLADLDDKSLTSNPISLDDTQDKEEQDPLP